MEIFHVYVNTKQPLLDQSCQLEEQDSRIMLCFATPRAAGCVDFFIFLFRIEEASAALKLYWNGKILVMRNGPLLPPSGFKRWNVPISVTNDGDLSFLYPTVLFPFVESWKSESLQNCTTVGVRVNKIPGLTVKDCRYVGSLGQSWRSGWQHGVLENSFSMPFNTDHVLPESSHLLFSIGRRLKSSFGLCIYV